MFFGHREAKEGEKLEGNDRFEGYSMDLISAIAEIRGFKFEFQIEPENKHGIYDPEKKKWNGLIKYLLDRVSTEL